MCIQDCIILFISSLYSGPFFRQMLCASNVGQIVKKKSPFSQTRRNAIQHWRIVYGRQATTAGDCTHGQRPMVVIVHRGFYPRPLVDIALCVIHTHPLLAYANGAEGSYD